MMLKKVVFSLIFASLICVAWSDVLNLKDGRTLEGDAVIHPGYVEIRANDGVHQILKTDILDLNGNAVQLEKNPIVRISTDVGDMICELYEDEAPNTVSNFINLAEKGFYRGLYFHRIIGGFMAQGGCPKSRYNLPEESHVRSGTGNPGYRIADEISNNLRHDARGILSMANSGPNSGGSQFFITFAPTPWLDGKHAIFGRVLEGWDTLTRLEGAAAEDNSGKTVTEIYFNVQVICKRDHEYIVDVLKIEEE